jgi:mitochondrial fission protein ELM1
VWLIIGPRAGDNEQTFALAEALGWPYEVKHLEFNRFELAAQILCGASLAGMNARKSSRLEPPWPDLILCTGRYTEAVACWIRNRAAPQKPRIVYLGRPFFRPQCYDLVITTPQYPAIVGSNVLRIALPLHRVAPARLAPAVRFWRPRFRGLPRPFIAVLVGGPVRGQPLDRAAAMRLAELACRQSRDSGGSLLVTTSYRTPAQVAETLQQRIEPPAFVHRWSSATEENPYLALLGLADEFIVTADSISMLTESVATGKPVSMFHAGFERTRAKCPAARKPARIGESIGEHILSSLIDAVWPKRLSRNIGRVHQFLVEAGLAWWIGSEARAPLSSATFNATSTVAKRVRSLMSQWAA